MSNEEILELTKRAFLRNEFAKLLSGQGEYTCPTNKFVPADVPTDVGRIIDGIYALYTETQNDEVISKYKNAIIELLHGNEIQVWLAYSICWAQHYRERFGKATFKLLDSELVMQVRHYLKVNEVALKQCHQWQGQNLKEGLWEDIHLKDNAIKDVTGVGLLWVI